MNKLNKDFTIRMALGLGLALTVSSCGLKAGFPEQSEEEAETPTLAETNPNAVPSAGVDPRLTAGSNGSPLKPLNKPVDLDPATAEKDHFFATIDFGKDHDKEQIRVVSETSNPKVAAPKTEIKPTVSCAISENKEDLVDENKIPLEITIIQGGDSEAKARMVVFQDFKTKEFLEAALFEATVVIPGSKKEISVSTLDPSKDGCKLAKGSGLSKDGTHFDASFECVLEQGSINIQEGSVRCSLSDELQQKIKSEGETVIDVKPESDADPVKGDLSKAGDLSSATGTSDEFKKIDSLNTKD